MAIDEPTFTPEMLAGYQGRKILEDFLAEQGLAVDVRRVGSHFIVRADSRQLAIARERLARAAPEVEVRFVTTGGSPRVLSCPSCGEYINLNIGLVFEAAQPGDRVQCPICDGFFTVPPQPDNKHRIDPLQPDTD